MNGIPAGELVDTGSNNGNCTSSWTLPTLPPAMASSPATSSVGSTIAGGGSSCIDYSHGHSWNQGQDGNLEITFPVAVTNWEIVLKFDNPVNTLSFYQGQVTKIDDTTFSIKNQNYNGVQSAGGKVSSGWQALFDETSDPPQMISAEAVNFECGSSGTQPTSTSQPESSENPTTEQTAAMSTTEKPSSIQITSNPSPLSTDYTIENTGSTASSEAPTTAAGNITTKYDYGEVIRLSNLFYQAQRSGELDAYGDFNHNLIPYRGDSSLQDGSDNGVDLTGGYHDGKSIFQFFCN